jgi:predicted nucleotidyltransferase
VPEKEPEFAEILARLNAAGVRYVLIGGLAMILHGSAHITQDIDIGYACSPQNFEALAVALRQMNARLRNVPPEIPFLLDAQTFRNTQNLTLETDFGALDLLGHIAGAEDFDRLYERSIEVEVESVPVRIASVDDLIAMKRAANRIKDRNHLWELEAFRRLQVLWRNRQEDI